MKRIYVDFDDVLSQTARSLVRLLESRHGRTVPFDRIWSFDLGRSFRLTPAELDRFMESAHEPAVLEAMAPVDGAVDVLGRWRSEGYVICVVTGRPPSTRAVSLGWLETHQIPFDELTFVDKYARAPLGSDGPVAIPLEELAGSEFCFAIDDAPVMVAFLAERMDVPVAVLDRPWNAELPPLSARAHRRVVRCRDWDGIDRAFRQSQKPSSGECDP